MTCYQAVGSVLWMIVQCGCKVSIIKQCVVAPQCRFCIIHVLTLNAIFLI